MAHSLRDVRSLIASRARSWVVPAATLALAITAVGCVDEWQQEPQTAYGAEESAPLVGESVAPSPYATAPGSTTLAAAPATDPAAAPVDMSTVAEDDPSALATFEPALSPYGSWVDDPVNGHVWVPSADVVGSDFSPYLTNGHWTTTDEGYYWASDYDWGWAPFHYGRWAWTGGYGWGWIPGAVWSPAWVDWRYGGGYMGWGPSCPSWGWRGGRGYALVGASPTPFVFAPSGRFFAPQPSAVVASPGASHGLVAGTTAYTPPARSLTGAHPFVGPDPSTAGIPPAHIAASRIATPTTGRPSTVAWKPAAASKLSPVRTGVAADPSHVVSAPKYTAPTLRPTALPTSRSTASAPVYRVPPSRPGYGTRTLPGGYSGSPSTRSAPSYGTHPSYAPAPSHPSYSHPTYSPPASHPTYSAPSGGGGGGHSYG
ncbi:MAG: DUF6600 domain-containing protein, partial [Polyangiales bacterium]